MKQKKALKKTVTFKIELEAAKLAQKAAIDSDMKAADWIAEAIRTVYNQPKKVTQVQIARECGVSDSYINQVIKGKRKPSKKVLSKMKQYGLLPTVVQNETVGRHDSGV